MRWGCCRGQSDIPQFNLTILPQLHALGLPAFSLVTDINKLKPNVLHQLSELAKSRVGFRPYWTQEFTGSTGLSACTVQLF